MIDKLDSYEADLRSFRNLHVEITVEDCVALRQRRRMRLNCTVLLRIVTRDIHQNEVLMTDLFIEGYN